MTNPVSNDEPYELGLTEFIEHLRRTPPRRGMPHKTFEELAAEQGVGPIDFDKLMAKAPGPLYEGFAEDVRAMRRGRPPLNRPKHDRR